MRIISGAFGGRRLRMPKGDQVRPTADRVREAWFSILGAAVPGARVLDLFAGSGALGLEALSRGAAHAEFVERHRLSLAALRENIAALGVEAQVAVRPADAMKFAAALPPGAFDIALADPPYATPHAAELVALFRNAPFARILSVEHAASVTLDGDDTRRYGDTAVTFLWAEGVGSGVASRGS
ncbi:MAG TPA: 16S rRNA (guanine(966)-N(2))-methyltransferase RsmD [Gemmatimonadales bacterium]|nr:16S rRNA (guanine(966)-N(2))-methyltransferase RsmD [Gemmatimonadales bacterium]